MQCELHALLQSNEELRTVCEDLNFTRVKTAKHLAERIMSELESLEMSKTKFEAEINFNDELVYAGARECAELERFASQKDWQPSALYI